MQFQPEHFTPQFPLACASGAHEAPWAGHISLLRSYSIIVVCIKMYLLNCLSENNVIPVFETRFAGMSGLSSVLFELSTCTEDKK